MSSSSFDGDRVAAEVAAALSSLSIDLNGDANQGTGGVGGGVRDSLDLTSEEVDFDGLGGDLRTFEQHELVKEALEKERDLRNYSRDIQKELAEYEGKCVEDYIHDADALSTLHGQIKSYDGILATMESMLAHFQSDLSAISSEIQFLQEKSYGMNIKLRNYKTAEKSLNSFIQSIYIPDDLCNLILDGDLNEPWVEGIKELDKKLIYLDSAQRNGGSMGSTPPSIAVKDMAPIGEKLKLKSIARIRAFLLERFHSLKKPKTNIQIKQKLLLKFSYFYQFLLHHADDRVGSLGSSSGNLHSLPPTPTGSSSGASSHLTSSSAASTLGASGHISYDICAEIRREYHETISSIYASKFKKYLTELRKLQADEKVRKEDVLGADTEGSNGKSSSSSSSSGSSGGMGGLFSSMFSLSSRSSSTLDTVFKLSGRESVLLGSNPNDGVGGPGAAGDRELIIPHLIGGTGTTVGNTSTGTKESKIPFEKLFRSAQSLLMDTATSEYDFIVEFFGERMQREMDRAGEHEDALAAEREEKERHDTNGVKKSTSAAGGGVPSYESSNQDERGRENLLPHSRDKHLFNLVFGKTITLFITHLEEFLFSTYDALGVLLVIRIVCQHNLQMQYRRVHCLDVVFDRMNMMLWPKFKNIFDENVASVMRLTPIEIKPGVKVKPHLVGTRYAEFASGILLLNEGYDDDILVANLKRLRNEIDKFFLRCVDRLPMQQRKLRLIFLLCNYHSILSILSSYKQVTSDDYKSWEDLTYQSGSKMVEVLLEEVFPSLAKLLESYGKEKSDAQREGRPMRLEGNELGFINFKKVIQQFQNMWRSGIEQFYNDINKHFAMEISSSDAKSSSASNAAAAGAAAGPASSGNPSIAHATNREQVETIFKRTLTQLMIDCTTLTTMYQEYQNMGLATERLTIVQGQEITIELRNPKYRR